jgi:cobalt-zinc-cadmium efflux system outer membrane protein
MLATLTIALLLGAATEEAPSLPNPLTLPQAEEIFLEHGLDLLVVEAQARGAEGDLRAAGAHPNPGLDVAVMFGPATNHDILASTGPIQQSLGLSLGLTDNAAIEDILSGKHSLRIQAAAKALASAQQAVEDLKRNELSELRQAFAAVLLAKENLDFAGEVQKSYDQTYDLNSIRYKKGDISEADLAKIAVAKLEADQAMTQAAQGLELSKDSLAFLLGVRGAIPEFEVVGSLEHQELATLNAQGADALLAQGLANRPDVKVAVANREQQEALVTQARRLVMPDIALQLGYSEQCNTAECSSAPTFNVGLQSNLPIFYQQQGEIRRAESNLAAATASEAKARAQVLSDVTQAWASYRSARELVDRMEKAELKQAKLSRDLEELMYRKGAASLLEFLDAERTYIATNLEYRQDLAAYWDAIYQLEQATAVRLR